MNQGDESGSGCCSDDLILMGPLKNRNFLYRHSHVTHLIKRQKQQGEVQKGALSKAAGLFAVALAKADAFFNIPLMFPKTEEIWLKFQ